MGYDAGVDHVPPPPIFLTGCRAWDAKPVTPRTCPVCRGGIRAGDDSYTCGRCDSASPRVEARCRAARIGRERRESAPAELVEFRRMLVKKYNKNLFTPEELDLMWHGYVEPRHRRDLPVVPNHVRELRDFCRSIGHDGDAAPDGGEAA